MSFAEGTTVPTAKTRGEIEGLVQRYGATQFASGWDGAQAGISFVAKGRRVKFTIGMPSREDKKMRTKALGRRSWGTPTEAEWTRTIEAEERRLWRCLLLAIKAKLEVVESGIASFEEEFLAHIVTDDGQTVFERITSGSLKLLGPVSS